jgi:hypothetical protein
MRFVELGRRAGAAALTVSVLLLSACGGGNTSSSHCEGPNCSLADVVVTLDQPTGDNTLEIAVDSGPASSFSLGVANLPYVTVTVCAPGSASQCVTIDHVFLDTGSIGFRVLRSAVAALGLPAVTIGQANAVECYPFVVGAVWGPLARADLHMGAELAPGVPVQLIDDAATPVAPPTADCLNAANGGLLQSVTALQAKAVLGVGMQRYDCGLICQLGDYSGTYAVYHACDATTGVCTPSALAPEQQVQNPVTFLPVNNNGTLIVMPALPVGGAWLAKGRLVFGIGTQSNNQIASTAQVYHVEPDPASLNYLYLGVTIAGVRYPYAYIDSGSNGWFFDDATLSTRCAGNGSGAGNWYCPASAESRSAIFEDAYGKSGQITFSIANADALFSSSNVAFANLGGAAGANNPGAFVAGLPFFFGRAVYTSIWGQALSANGPWYAF